MGRGEVRLASPLCGQPAGTLQAPASPCPAHPDPCCRGTETRRPPWTRTRTTQGQRQTRAESARARGARGRRPRAPGGEWHRAPLGPRWAGACAGPDARRGGEDRLPTAGGRFRSRCLPTWSRARSSWERWEPRESGSGTRTGRQGVDFLGKPGSLDRLDPVAPGKGPRSVLAGFPPRCLCSRSVSSLPLPSPPYLRFFSSVISRWFS